MVSNSSISLCQLFFFFLTKCLKQTSFMGKKKEKRFYLVHSYLFCRMASALSRATPTLLHAIIIHKGTCGVTKPHHQRGYPKVQVPRCPSKFSPLNQRTPIKPLKVPEYPCHTANQASSRQTHIQTHPKHSLLLLKMGHSGSTV